MILDNVADQMRAALDTVPLLRCPPWGEKASGKPAALVGWPEQINFTSTYGRGKAEIADWPVFIIVSASPTRSGNKAMAGFLADAGSGSALVALEAGPYTACDFVHVDYAELDPDARYEGNQVLAAILHCKVVGPGK